MNDLKIAWRTLGRSPGFAATSVLLLALAIGANTAVFTVAKAALFERLPVADPDGLYLLGEARSWGVLMGQTGSQQALSYPLYRELRDRDEDFSALAACGSFLLEVAARPGLGDPLPAQTELVSGNYFSTLGAGVAAGRPLAPADDAPGAPAVAVVSHAFWRSTLGGSAAAVGSTLHLNGRAFTIVGVAAPEFFGETIADEVPEIWVPLARQPELTGRSSLLEARRPSWLYAIGRLRPGVAPAAARAHLDVAVRGWLTAMAAELSPEERAGIGRATFELTSAARGISHRRTAFAHALWLLLGASGTILLLACGNVSILFLARIARREREMDVRRALGASGTRVVRIVATEGLLLAAAGGVLGVASAWPLAKILSDWAAAAIAPGAAEHVDGTVALFAAGAAVLAAALVSVAPAVRLLRRNAAIAARGMAVAGASQRATAAAPRAFIALELALTLPLLLIAGLMVGSLQRLLAVNPGFASANLLVARVSLRPAHLSAAELPALYRTLEANLQGLPGIRAAGLALYGPLHEGGWVGPVEPESDAKALSSQERTSWWNRVGPGYLEALGVRLAEGRLLAPQDAGTGAVVVNRELARRFFAGASPLGRRFTPAGDAATRYEVVGVVDDLQFDSLRAAPMPMYFTAFGSGAAAEADDPSYVAGEIALRTEGGGLSAADLRRVLRATHPDILLQELSSMSERVAQTTARERMTATLCEIAGALAMLLAVFGIGSVVAQSTAQRTRELGLRLAIGAAPHDLVRLVLGGTMRMALVGLGAGAGVALIALRLVQQELFEVASLEWGMLGLAAATLLGVSLLAGAIPALRAARLDPVEALRVD